MDSSRLKDNGRTSCTAAQLQNERSKIERGSREGARRHSHPAIVQLPPGFRTRVSSGQGYDTGL